MRRPISASVAYSTKDSKYYSIIHFIENNQFEIQDIPDRLIITTSVLCNTLEEAIEQGDLLIDYIMENGYEEFLLGTPDLSNYRRKVELAPAELECPLCRTIWILEVVTPPKEYKCAKCNKMIHTQVH